MSIYTLFYYAALGIVICDIAAMIMWPLSLDWSGGFDRAALKACMKSSLVVLAAGAVLYFF